MYDCEEHELKCPAWGKIKTLKILRNKPIITLYYIAVFFLLPQLTFASVAKKKLNYNSSEYRYFSHKSKFYTLEENIISKDEKGIYEIDQKDSSNRVVYKMLAAWRYLKYLMLSNKSTYKIENEIFKIAKEGYSMYPKIPEIKMLYANILSYTKHKPVEKIFILSTITEYIDLCPRISVLLSSCFNTMYLNSEGYRKDKNLKDSIIFAMMGDSPDDSMKKSRIMASYWVKKIDMKSVPDIYKPDVIKLASKKIDNSDANHIWESIIKFRDKLEKENKENIENP
jgi:hypothetical protein